MRSLAACLFLLLLAITCVSVETDTNIGVPTPSPTFTLGLLSSPPESTPNPLEQLIEQVRQETIADESMTPTPYELPATPTVGPTPTLSPTNTPIPLFMDSDMLVDIVQQVRPAIVKVRIPGSTGSGVIFQADGRDAISSPMSMLSEGPPKSLSTSMTPRDTMPPYLVRMPRETLPCSRYAVGTLRRSPSAMLPN